MEPHIQYSSPSDTCMRFILKATQSLRFTKCCCMFSLRTGTVLVAIVHLVLTSITLFLLLLAATNTQEIATITAAEIRAFENSWSSDMDGSVSSILYTNNEKKMLTGQHLATVLMSFIYAGVIISVIYIVLCFMLLYGALYYNSNFLIPWLSGVLLATIISSLSLMSVFLYSQFIHRNWVMSFHVTLVFILGQEIYAWLIVFSYYREITSKDTLIYRNIESSIPIHQVHHCVNVTKSNI